MKLLFVLAVATSTIMLVQGAPQIWSEEMGKAVEQLKEMITSEIQADGAKAAYGPRKQNYDAQSAEAKAAYPIWARQGAQSAQRPQEQGYDAQSANHPREQGYGYYRHGATSVQKDRVTAQVNGIDIRNCGTTGTIINSALSFLNILFPGRFGVLVDCQVSQGCVQVRVDVPAEKIVTDVDVCDLGNGQACVEVYVQPTTTCPGAVPITIPIPLPNGQQIFIQIAFNLLSNPGCATVRVNAPQC